MPTNFISEDLRSRKTEKALYTAMFSLLKKTTFRKITIKGICEEALISRAAFYAHFIDKYDLLEHWMTALWPKEIEGHDDYNRVEKAVNDYVQENTLIFRNLMYDADNETFGILFDFLLSTIQLDGEKGNVDDTYIRRIVLSNFYAGGTISYLLWQIKNKFPPDVPLMNRHFYKMIHELQDWQST